METSLRHSRLLLTGCPVISVLTRGSGKGTQAKRLSSKFNLPILSSGDLLRKLVQQNTLVSKQIQSEMSCGGLVSDCIMVQAFYRELSCLEKVPGYILDGFPRTQKQAEMLDHELEKRGMPLSAVFSLKVPEHIVIERLAVHIPSGRIYHSLYNPPKHAGLDDVTGEELVKRTDDNPLTIKKRLQSFYATNEPMQKYYQSKSVLYECAGSTSDEIYPQIERVLHLASKSIQTLSTRNPKALLPNNQLKFGASFTDHMLTIDWTEKKGWETPRIIPYGPLSLDPSALVFHYSLECFEGMKAYKDANGNIRMFRPDMNVKRFLASSKRIGLPSFDEMELLECIKALLRIEKRWIPQERGYSLYLRPTHIATKNALGVGPTDSSLLYVICSPVGPYFPSGFSAVRLKATTEYVRAWTGGSGNYKVGSNYGPTIMPQVEAQKQGFQQLLWLYGKEDYMTEVGTMNMFVLWKNKNGEKELLTPPLDGTILPGVTRDSIIQFVQNHKEFVNDFKLSERKLPMAEFVEAWKEGRVMEVFGAGTACIVCPVKEIHYNGQALHIPLDKKDASKQAGPLTTKLAKLIMGIQYGEIEHEWSVVLK